MFKSLKCYVLIDGMWVRVCPKWVDTVCWVACGVMLAAVAVGVYAATH